MWERECLRGQGPATCRRYLNIHCISSHWAIVRSTRRATELVQDSWSGACAVVLNMWLHTTFGYWSILCVNRIRTSDHLYKGITWSMSQNVYLFSDLEIVKYLKYLVFSVRHNASWFNLFQNPKTFWQSFGSHNVFQTSDKNFQWLNSVVTYRDTVRTFKVLPASAWQTDLLFSKSLNEKWLERVSTLTEIAHNLAYCPNIVRKVNKHAWPGHH